MRDYSDRAPRCFLFCCSAASCAATFRRSFGSQTRPCTRDSLRSPRYRAGTRCGATTIEQPEVLSSVVARHRVPQLARPSVAYFSAYGVRLLGEGQRAWITIRSGGSPKLAAFGPGSLCPVCFPDTIPGCAQFTTVDGENGYICAQAQAAASLPHGCYSE